MMTCADCGKPIYKTEEEEAEGGKHVIVVGADDQPPTTSIICMPCSELPKYTHIGETL